jgi:hypothetical protein
MAEASLLHSPEFRGTDFPDAKLQEADPEGAEMAWDGGSAGRHREGPPETWPAYGPATGSLRPDLVALFRVLQPACE